MKELLDTFDAWRRDGARVGRAVVIKTYGSAPRPEGSVMLYASDGRICGSVSGGCVEGAAAAEIDRAMASGESRVVSYGVTDEQAWSVGLACGGTIEVLVEPEVPAQAIAAAASAAGKAVVTELPADGRRATARVTVDADGQFDGMSGDSTKDAAIVNAAHDALLRGRSRTLEVGQRRFFVEVFPVRPRLVVVGAVEIARALVALARQLGYETVVVDGRPAFATAERFPGVDRLIVGWLDEVADEVALGPNDAVAVLTHDAKFDEPALLTAFRRGCRYVGAIGSRKTQADRRARLSAAGLSDADLARLRGPIGLDLGGRSPAETALAVMAEIIAVRYGATGSALT